MIGGGPVDHIVDFDAMRRPHGTPSWGGSTEARRSLYAQQTGDGPMSLDAGRRNAVAVAIYWLLLGVGLGALALGWSSTYAPLDEQTRDYLGKLHISFGLAAATLVLVQFLLCIALFAFGAAKGRRDWRNALSFALRLLVYFSLLASIVTGILGAAFRGEQIYFWGYALPFWDAGDPSTSELLRNAHPFAAYALAGSIAAYLIVAVINLISPSAPSGARALELAAPPSPPSIASLLADGLAYNFRLFGGAAFWLQFFLGIISALLLAFGFVGHSVSPGGGGFGDAIYWASGGLLNLFLAAIFGFQYMKTARKITASPERYLGPARRSAFWFLGAGGFLSVIGALISFVGVGLSVALLIGKTVSQPPGIAIVDPHKIIRALDIFILLVNFNLLFAHFIGVAIAAWLSIGALKARHQYVVASEETG
jgi:cytochrome b561